LFDGELLEYAAASRIARHARRTRVELEAAALGRDGDAERVAREHRVGRRRRHGRGPALSTGLTGPVNLQHALPRFEAARRGNFLDQRFDVRAQKIERLIARLANEMKMPRMPIGRL